MLPFEVLDWRSVLTFDRVAHAPRSIHRQHTRLSLPFPPTSARLSSPHTHIRTDPDTRTPISIPHCSFGVVAVDGEFPVPLGEDGDSYTPALIHIHTRSARHVNGDEHDHDGPRGRPVVDCVKIRMCMDTDCQMHLKTCAPPSCAAYLFWQGSCHAWKYTSNDMSGFFCINFFRM